MTHTIEKYGDVGNFSGVTYVMLPFVNLKFVGTWASTAKIVGDIPNFNVLNVPKTQPRHNPNYHTIINEVTRKDHKIQQTLTHWPLGEVVTGNKV